MTAAAEMHGADWSAGASRRLVWSHVARLWTEYSVHGPVYEAEQELFPFNPPTPPLPLLSPPPFSAVAAIVHSVCTLDGKGSTQYMHHALRNICNGMHATLLVLCQWCHMYLLGVLCTSATACSKGDKFLMRHALRLLHPPLQMPSNASNSPKTLMGGPGTGPRV